MIRFLHPNAAWFFLVLIPVIAAYLWKPAFRQIIVPSLLCWEEKKETEGVFSRPHFRLPCFPLSFWVNFTVVILLVTAMMTPLTLPKNKVAQENPIRILRSGPESIPLDRALDRIGFPNISFIEIPERLSENELLVLTGRPPISLPEGNVLLVNPSDIPKLSDNDQPTFTCRLSAPNQEIMQFCYPHSFTKLVQFPMMTAKLIDHFRHNGIAPFSEKKEPHRYSRWLIIGAALILVFEVIYSLLRNWNE